MNALFSFRIKFTVGEHFIFGVAQATALRLKALPIPEEVKVNIQIKEKSAYKSKANVIEDLSKWYSELISNCMIRRTLDYNIPQDLVEDAIDPISSRRSSYLLDIKDDHFAENNRFQIISNKQIDDNHNMILNKEDKPNFQNMQDNEEAKEYMASVNNVNFEMSSDTPYITTKKSLNNENEERKSVSSDRTDENGLDYTHKKLSEVQEEDNDEEDSTTLLKVKRDTQNTNPFSFDEKPPGLLSVPKPGLVEETKGEYFESLNDETLIKHKEHDVKELIVSSQLKNTTFMIEIDDLNEIDSLISLIDPMTPENIKIYNSESFPGIMNVKREPKLKIKCCKFKIEDNEIQKVVNEKHQFLSK